MLRKRFIFMIILLVVIIGAPMFIIWQVKPTEALNLDYKEISIPSKIAEIVKSRKLEVQLTEQDINDLVKKQLAEHQVLPHDFRLEGAKLTLNGSNLEADLNLRWHDKLPISAKMMFTLAYHSPNMSIQHVSTSVKGTKIPSEWLHLDPIVFSIEDHLPLLIGVKNVVFEEKAVVVQLKALR
ncbi:hypothetical protein [Paenibacillus ferrarius]|nr:hypothetical protein [Paenibacillus ferrarius]